MPSDLYYAALADATAHHARSKTYSGKLLRPHKLFLTELVAAMGITSALDYGAGKGDQYHWVDPADGQTIEQAWGFEVRKYDPAWPPFAAAPRGQFDLVICTHTLGSIPLADHAWVIDNLLGHAAKAVFIAEKIGKVKKSVHGAREGFANGWSTQYWANALMTRKRDTGSSLPIHLSTVERIMGEKITSRLLL